MATGYTACIEEGVSFKEFALNCANAFGACISLRDEPMDTPIPEEFKVDDYHLRELNRAKKELIEAEKLSLKECNINSKKEFDETEKYNRESIAKNLSLKKKYESMLRQVNAYEPPTKDHINFKEFMVEQITESIKFDCGISYYKNGAAEPETGKEWKTKNLDRIKQNIKYHTKGYKEEVERTKSRNNWVKELRKSLQ